VVVDEKLQNNAGLDLKPPHRYAVFSNRYSSTFGGFFPVYFEMRRTSIEGARAVRRHCESGASEKILQVRPRSSRRPNRSRPIGRAGVEIVPGIGGRPIEALQIPGSSDFRYSCVTTGDIRRAAFFSVGDVIDGEIETRRRDSFQT